MFAEHCDATIERTGTDFGWCPRVVHRDRRCEEPAVLVDEDVTGRYRDRGPRPGGHGGGESRGQHDGDCDTGGGLAEH